VAVNGACNVHADCDKGLYCNVAAN
jgi:hypothetical protein